MVPRKKRTRDEAWDALEKMDVDDEVDRVLALNREELDRELAAGGLDPQRVRERGRALAERLEKEPAGVATGNGKTNGGAVRAKKVSRMRAPWAVIATAAAGGLSFLVQNGEPLVAKAPPHEDLAAAESLRKKATNECGASQWAACVAHLNEARTLDPAGDEDARVREMRRVAESALHVRDAGR
jgi:hypothetical protein